MCNEKSLSACICHRRFTNKEVYTSIGTGWFCPIQHNFTRICGLSMKEAGESDSNQFSESYFLSYKLKVPIRSSKYWHRILNLRSLYVFSVILAIFSSLLPIREILANYSPSPSMKNVNWARQIEKKSLSIRCALFGDAVSEQ